MLLGASYASVTNRDSNQGAEYVGRSTAEYVKNVHCLVPEQRMPRTEARGGATLYSRLGTNRVLGGQIVALPSMAAYIVRRAIRTGWHTFRPYHGSRAGPLGNRVV